MIVGTHARTPWGTVYRIMAEQRPPLPGGERRWVCDQIGGTARLIIPTSELTPVDKPVARRTDPGTSHRAARRAELSAESNKARLLIAHADAGDVGMTGDDIRVVFGRGAYERFGPRRPSLERAGLIRKAIGDDGRPVERGGKQVYRVTPSGEIEANRLRKESA